MTQHAIVSKRADQHLNPHVPGNLDIQGRLEDRDAPRNNTKRCSDKVVRTTDHAHAFAFAASSYAHIYRL
jgi:hypothetical protein